MEVDYKKLINIFYVPLMIFLVFTFAWKLLQGLIHDGCIDLILYTIMWLFLVVQTTFAYVHIMKIRPKEYSIWAFISDCIDIGVASYVCAAIGSTYDANGYSELTNYIHLSAPFIVLALNQFSWYVIVKEFNVPAIFRISILFFGMLAVTISEGINHSSWNLVVVVCLIVLLGILRAIDISPRLFTKVVTKIWKHLKVKYLKNNIQVQIEGSHNTEIKRLNNISMKKLLFILLSALSLTASAEDVIMALIRPRAEAGTYKVESMEINMTRGELRNAFTWQAGFRVVTRTDVDALLNEHGFQQSGMVADNQRTKIGEMTGAQYICVSTITKYASQLYIEAYLVNVETGEMTNSASQYVNIKNEDYSLLPEACSNLASEMLGEIGGGKKRSPGIGLGNNKNVPAGYVDLGLPSGTLWKAENEDCGLIKYDQAVNFYGQFEELKNNCLWTWQGNGYKVKGKNGESIFLPAAGDRNCGGSVYEVGSYGYCWSSTPYGSENAWFLYFNSSLVYLGYNLRCGGHSVRLVK